MNLADAIRTGSKTTKQHFGEMYKMRYGAIGYTCALGAAAVAVGDGCDGWTIANTFPELRNDYDACPDCGETLDVQSLAFAITHLNDEHHWKREAIADWIDTITLDLAPVAVAVEAQT